MLYTILDDLIFYQILRVINKFTNFELKLYRYFIRKTHIYPQNIVNINNFVFFFVNNEDYFYAKNHINSIRKELIKKVIIIRAENTLITLLYSLFPDLYIHDIKIEWNVYSGKREISVNFLSFKERGIAIGCNGDYIKTVNQLFEKNVIFQNDEKPFKINCISLGN
ncbi:MAG: hypothetical protein EU531_05735 [Promethearchaeota archaeon]|nr:MAG: hypothetical protein EU531_05735 [Candidatus Lokiarchaeota archaeon]